MQFISRLSLVLVLLPSICAGVPPTNAQGRLKVEIVPKIGHTDWVESVAVSPDGTRVLSGSLDNTVKLWDAATGRLLRTFGGHSKGVKSVAFSPDGTRLLSGSWDNTLKLWEASTGHLLRTFEGHSSSVFAVAFSPDGTRLLSGSSDKTIKLWELSTGQLIRTFKGHSHSVVSVAFSPHGTHLLTGSSDKTIKLWDAGTGRLLHTFKGHTNQVNSVRFSPNGTRVVSGSADRTLKLWDSTGGLMRTFEGHGGLVNSAAFSPDGARVVSGSTDGTLNLWDAATGELLRTIPGDSGDIQSVVFSPDGRHLLSGGADNTAQLWDASTAELIRTFQGNSSWVDSVAVSLDGTRLLSGSSDATLSLWDAATGQLIRTFKGHAGAIQSVAFSPDGAHLLSASADKTLKLWDAATGQLTHPFNAESEVRSAAFSPDGKRVLSGTWDNTLKLWDAVTGQLLHTFKGHSEWVYTVAFSPDGTRLLSGSADKTLKLWDATTGDLVRTFKGHSNAVFSVAFSPDGTRLLSGSTDKTLKLWDAATGRVIRTIEDADWVWSVAFSPDGTRLLSGGTDKTLKLWNAVTGRLVRAFKGHAGQIKSVAFLRNGDRVVSGSDDGTMRVWDAETGAQLVVLSVQGEGKWLALTPAGFFAGSRLSNDFLGIVRGLNVITIDQIHQSLFNPDLVREVLAGDPSSEVQEAAKVINLEKVVDSGPAPAVSIVSPAEGSKLTSDLATITARIEDRGKGVGRIEWRVNGVTVAVVAKPPGNGPSFTLSQQLALDLGDNMIEVVAYNASNLLASLLARTTIKFTGSPDRAKPKLHILAIGVDAYIEQPLGLAVKDAKAFAASMRKAAGDIYEEVRVTFALDKDATRDNLEKVVDAVAAQIYPRDTFILFAAGHGLSENGRFYFIPQDYQSGLGDLAQTAVGQDRLQDWLANRIKARRAIILLDTCESGALVAGHARPRADAPASEAAVGRLHEATGRPVLTAAAAGQFAHEGLIGASGERHGVFTWAVLDALRKGDSNGNGIIELSELVRYVQSVVPKIAANMGGAGRAATSEPVWGQQAARFGSRGEDFALVQRLR